MAISLKGWMMTVHRPCLEGFVLFSIITSDCRANMRMNEMKKSRSKPRPDPDLILTPDQSFRSSSSNIKVKSHTVSTLEKNTDIIILLIDLLHYILELVRPPVSYSLLSVMANRTFYNWGT